jgi:hypothetical protein
VNGELESESALIFKAPSKLLPVAVVYCFVFFIVASLFLIKLDGGGGNERGVNRINALVFKAKVFLKGMSIKPLIL